MHKLEDYKMVKKAKLYQKGVISFQEAASSAGVSLYQMMDFVQREQIHPPTQTRTEFREEITQSMNWLSK